MFHEPTLRKFASKKITFTKYTILIFFSFFSLLPFVTCLFASFKSDYEFNTSSKLDLPKNWLNFENYKIALNHGNLFHAMIVTVVVVIMASFVSVLLSSMVAYVLYRTKFRFRTFTIYLFLFTSTVPRILIQVSVFYNMVNLRLVDSIFGYVLVLSNVDIILIYLFAQYFRSIPESIDEAAIIEGCSKIGVFLKIHLPVSIQTFVTGFILKGFFVYNEYYLASLYLQDKNRYPTITTALYSFTGPYGSKFNIISAGVIIVIMPLLISFVFFQKKIYNGMNMNLNIKSQD